MIQRCGLARFLRTASLTPRDAAPSHRVAPYTRLGLESRRHDAGRFRGYEESDMRAIIALVVVSVSALVVEAGPLKRLREWRDDRASRAEVVVEKDGAKKVSVRGGSEAVITKDRVEIRQAAPKKAN